MAGTSELTVRSSTRQPTSGLLQHLRTRRKGRGIAPPARPVGLDGLDLVGLGVSRLALGPLDLGRGEPEARSDVVGHQFDL